ncbi:hypothetical protein [Pseudomonas brassicacearum]|uniref:hypothetical protein n=1 Tax=Pseudomonas brassicacearum TaxID=930166 RepID=UPI0005763F22|nr:hypothetical protein [Pseudomonas brassicacearum]ROM90617.1 hypothetical protein BK656_23985 [Pseudomonas brassicacearum]
MLQLLFALLAGTVAAITGYFSSLFFAQRAKSRYRIIEFTLENGKKQRIKVSSLNPAVIKDAVESELRLENFIRSSLKDLVQSNGKIKVREDDLADFVITQGDQVVIIEAKASANNMTDDFLPKLEKKFQNPFTILLVDKITNDYPMRKTKNFKIIRRDRDDDFKLKFLREIINALSIK